MSTTSRLSFHAISDEELEGLDLVFFCGDGERNRSLSSATFGQIR